MQLSSQEPYKHNSIHLSPLKASAALKKILNVISQLHLESFEVQLDAFVFKESSCAIEARNNFLSSDLVSLLQKGAEMKKKYGFAGKREGLGSDPLSRFLSCSIARGLKQPREKKKKKNKTNWVEIKPCSHKAEEISLDTEEKTN